jgi:MFS family permease
MSSEGHRHYESWRVGALAGLALVMLLPVTLPVPVLRELVSERFGVSEFWTSLFMSINMVGAVLAAPLAGAAADRFGQRPRWIAAALVLDAVCFLGLTLDLPFPVFMAIRFLEGCAHIFALSLLLGLAATARPTEERGVTLGATGAGLLLGVAVGAPLGGFLGAEDAIRPLYTGAVVVLVGAGLALALLRETGEPQEARPGFAEIRRMLAENRLLWVPLLFAFADRFTVGFFTSTFSLFLRNVHELEPARVGILIAVFMIPFALLSFPFGWVSQRSSRAMLLCGGSLIYGVLVGSVGFWPGDTLLIPMIATGTAAAVMFVPSMLMTTEMTPESVRTTSMGAFNAAGSLGFIVGPAVGGLVSQWVAGYYDWHTGYQAAFLVAGSAEILLALVAFPVLWRFERARREHTTG